ncbi:ABC transporter substrate-binding protein [Paenibacillus ginsengarvi]|uniref:Extracellular solute-binding protein n=1 Tax=Paenibacillus ginsengarvi TaxID=400777 RepID=A0A3B0CNN5_9BACL|nr:extracellular solute-binding protein [Paenibacillus ginsengarvi]RKN86074.1 extracellular solute-binding protein [Paenibacillus ginsengarvi]
MAKSGSVAWMLVLLLIVGCNGTASNSENAGDKGEERKENQLADEYKGGPAELVVYDRNAGLTDEEFQKVFVQPLKAKYPEISLKHVKAATISLENMLAGGTPPDIVLTSNVALATIADMDYPTDVNEMMARFKVDMGRVEPAVVTELRKFGKKGELFGIPFAMNYGAMMYNKDVFDKFAVAYPRDSMTWDEIYELAIRLTRTDGNVKYIGASPGPANWKFRQYSLPVFDDKTGRASVSTEGHKKAFELMQKFYKIPGYVDQAVFEYPDEVFVKEGRMAMFPTWIAGVTYYLNQSGGKLPFNWDLAAYPAFADRPNLGQPVDFHSALVYKASKNKEAAYQLLRLLLTDDIQMMLSRGGRLPVIKDDAIRKQFGEENGYYKGKNLQAIFKVGPSPAPSASIYDTKINVLVNTELAKSIAVDGVDINSALRSAEEKANKEIVQK